MKKIFMLAIGLVLLTSCTSVLQVTSYDEYERSLQKVKADLSSNGYELSGNKKETSNTAVVTATSYTEQGGYGTKMENDFSTQDSYTFTNSQGDVLEINLKLRERYSRRSDKDFLETVELLGCKTSKASDYEKLCGNSSVIKPTLGQMNRDIEVEVYDKDATLALSIGIVLLGSLALIPFGL